MDPSELGIFAQLLNESGLRWPDRARAEAAEILLEPVPKLGK
ncbi:hypothetical protein OKC48_25825 [Methylorubrum extorquens]|nr:hypothetical protein [Methylorubrum extorquens]UYW26628.1 hypothetical protein OKC48_25825 [Methylorubrum extorquens]